MNFPAREITEALLALLVVGGIVGIALYDGIAGKPVAIPPELYGFGGIVIGAYFRGTSSTNGVVGKLVTALKESIPPSTDPEPAPLPLK